MALGNLKKLGWFVALWITSVLALGVVAYAIRLVIHG
ncbi:DUF2474 family protein [Sulfitobacter sp. M57]|nr:MULTISPECIES: DUF2474 family protein [unclassified Sulfitobacter]MDF3415084.1 DUF2474 family protein [Sulfitobacter sp. KE5]MDF3422565.1 DUF2474 family protein [Sulfitobacter sp. KE43]MDF3433630.1 DUF2474 family protein [Sulfitobacter sp. KE42]MDF3459270.1 DUF2474 family protein [Sulfitobacter sp. S74]MDF3463169.1 DUF2474 family protein [Sulfitobacter sp. Ks18]